MPIVTALRAAPRGGFVVHVDGESFCSAGEALVARLRLFEGRELDDGELAELRRAASAERVMADAHRLLAHRARSREELRRRLLQKGHDAAVIGAALEALAADRLLDDAEFARAYAADKRALSGWGGQRIRRGLADLGVADGVIDAALGAAAAADTDDDAELERALAHLQRRGPPREPLDADRRRAYQALVRRGYGPAVAYAAIRRWSGQGHTGADET